MRNKVTAAAAALALLCAAVPLPASAEEETSYRPLIERYCTRLEEGFDKYADEDTTLYGVLLDNPSQFSYLWYRDTGKTKDNTGYSCLDINGDGTQELICGEIGADGTGVLYDLYTIYNGEICHLCAAGERDYFEVGTNGEIIETGSGGAALSQTIFYNFRDGVLIPSEVYQFNYGSYQQATTFQKSSYDLQGVTYYYYEFTWKDITEEVYNKRIAAHTAQSLSLTPFSQYGEPAPGGEPSLGDFDSDGNVNASDAAEVLIAAARFGAGETNFLNDSQRFAADTNSDSHINAEDAANILQYAAFVGAGGSGSLLEFLENPPQES